MSREVGAGSFFDSEAQEEVARTLLSGGSDIGFALAGSGALKVHGLVSRLSNDLDFFLDIREEGSFGRRLDDAISRLEDRGYAVSVVQRGASYAKVTVSGSNWVVDVDFACDYFDEPPEDEGFGLVRSEDDSVGAKVATLYSRGMPRDYLDVQEIRKSGRFTDERLLELARSQDLGIDEEGFAAALRAVGRIGVRAVSGYGYDEEALGKVKRALLEWADSLAG